MVAIEVLAQVRDQADESQLARRQSCLASALVRGVRVGRHTRRAMAGGCCRLSRVAVMVPQVLRNVGHGCWWRYVGVQVGGQVGKQWAWQSLSRPP